MIEVRDVAFSFLGENILDGISFAVPKGSFIGIKGTNGSGKTTLLRLLVGLAKPTRGEVVIGSNEKIAYVKQTAPGEEGNFPATVEEIVALGFLRPHSLFPSSKRRLLLDGILEQTGLGQMRKKLFAELSGGQKQRLKLAKALAEEPTVLVLDEPTSGLDHEGREALYSIISSFVAEGKTVIMVSHEGADFASADVIYRLVDGHLEKEAPHVAI